MGAQKVSSSLSTLGQWDVEKETVTHDSAAIRLGLEAGILGMKLHGLVEKRDPLQAVGELRVEIIPPRTSMTSDLGYGVVQCQG